MTKSKHFDALVTMSQLLAADMHGDPLEIPDDIIESAVNRCADILDVTEEEKSAAIEKISRLVEAAVAWPHWQPDLEVLGVLAYLSTPDAVIDPELFPGRVADMGQTEEGWRLGLMLRSIYEGANEATRKVIDGDALTIPYHIAQLMTGAMTEI